MGEEEEDQDMVRERFGGCGAAGGVRAFACDTDRVPIVPPSAGHWAMHPTCKAALQDYREVFGSSFEPPKHL